MGNWLSYPQSDKLIVDIIIPFDKKSGDVDEKLLLEKINKAFNIVLDPEKKVQNEYTVTIPVNNSYDIFPEDEEEEKEGLITFAKSETTVRRIIKIKGEYNECTVIRVLRPNNSSVYLELLNSEKKAISVIKISNRRKAVKAEEKGSESDDTEEEEEEKGDN